MDEGRCNVGYDSGACVDKDRKWLERL